MDKQTIELAILGLEEQSRKINEALRDLKSQLSRPGPNSRPATVVAAVVAPTRTFTPAQRRAISARMKRSWARRKAGGAGKSSAAATPKKRRLTVEQKRAISERMKATWAARRKGRR